MPLFPRRLLVREAFLRVIRQEGTGGFPLETLAEVREQAFASCKLTRAGIRSRSGGRQASDIEEAAENVITFHAGTAESGASAAPSDERPAQLRDVQGRAG